MFFTRKDKTNRPRPSSWAADRYGARRNGFLPRVETLEGRALPSVSHLTLTIPVASLYGDFSISYTIRIDFYNSGNTITGASYSLAETFRQPNIASPRMESVPQNTTVMPVSAAVQNTVSQDATATLRATPTPAPVAAPTATSGELAAIAFASSASATRPTIRPTTPEAPLTLFSSFGDQPQLQPFYLSAPVLPGINKLATDSRLLQPILQPVQAISNRMEFLGGSGTVVDNAAPDENLPDQAQPQPRPANPPAPESADVAALGGMLNMPLGQAGLGKDAWVPDAMVLATLVGDEGAGQHVLSPELLTEVATLAASLGTFAMVSPPRIPARRGSERGEMEIVLEREKIRQ
jgi:hypothetical protein